MYTGGFSLIAIYTADSGEMCQTMISDVDDMDEITSTCHKKTGKLIEPRKVRTTRSFYLLFYHFRDGLEIDKNLRE